MRRRGVVGSEKIVSRFTHENRDIVALAFGVVCLLVSRLVDISFASSNSEGEAITALRFHAINIPVSLASPSEQQSSNLGSLTHRVLLTFLLSGDGKEEGKAHKKICKTVFV